jgi:putative DNA methylase
MTTSKKLIEVALPLQAINEAAAREKSIRQGHPSTLHLWWARRPLAAARAVIFGQMVDDPSTYVDQLRGDSKLRRKAESLLRARRKRWEEASTLFEKANQAGISAPAPGPEPTLDDILAEIERDRLFKIIVDMVQWENTTNENVLQKAREEIWQSWRRACAENADHPRAKELFNRHRLPAFHDPFAGGGALPLEAQRLGLEAHASDLNPVAVLICKAMIEIPPKFAGKLPVNPESRKKFGGSSGTWKGVQGLAEDVRYYGKWIRDQGEERVGYLYPPVYAIEEKTGEWRHATVEEQTDWEAEQKEKKSDPDFRGRSKVKPLTVVAWLWARTVKSPNPAFRHVDVPLASTFMLSTKPGKEAWVEPVIEDGSFRFKVIATPMRQKGEEDDSWAKRLATARSKMAKAKAGTRLARGANFRCVMSGTPIAGDYMKGEGRAGRMGARLMAIAAEGQRGRIYLAPTPEHESVARKAKPEWKPKGDVPPRLTGGTCVPYGLATWGDLFTPRQLVALTTFSALMGEVMQQVRRDASAAGLPDDPTPLRDGGKGATAYAEAVGIYLAFAVSNLLDDLTTLAIWRTGHGTGALAHAFGRQAIPMTWDYPEANPFSGAAGDPENSIEAVARCLNLLPCLTSGRAAQVDATGLATPEQRLISTDPPYYDNVSYADLSDYFYVWLRRILKGILPDLFATLAVPKAEELVAAPYRHGSKEKAEAFFLDGMTRAMRRLATQSHPALPVTIYYAFKQSESESIAGTVSTGWETFLDAVISAGFGISGTWPIRTERTQGLKGETNALASSILLVCRPRAADAQTATRREFVAALQRELPQALRHLQAGNIAPVDLAQAAIGPGMAVFTRYAKVLDAQGNVLSVHQALALINETLDTALAEQEGDFDAATRFALTWFEQFGFGPGEFGIAETLSKAKNTSVAGLDDAGILESSRGDVRLLKPEELDPDWDPATDHRLTSWEMVHHLIRVLGSGEENAAELVVKLGAKAETARELAYRLYNLCERKKRAAEALSYNALVQSWPDLVRRAEELGQGGSEQQPLGL